jgi:hypothetical protein
MTDERPAPRRRRRWLLPVSVVAAVLVYAVVVLLYAGGLGDSAVLCEEPSADQAGRDHVTVNLMPSAVHAVEQRVDMQLVVDPAGSLLDDDGFTIGRGFGLLLYPVNGSQVVPFAAGDVISTQTVSFYTEGAVEQWPFDTYSTDIVTVAYSGEGSDRVGIPTYVCIDGSVPGWHFEAHRVDETGNTVDTPEGQQELQSVVVTATRSASTVAFGVVLLGLMALAPVLVLFVAISAYIGRRKVEATLTSWMGAMLFAILPLRNFLPGAPPVGSWIDYTIVLWVIVGLVAGLTIYVMAWSRWGTRAAPRGAAPPRDPLS